MFVTNIGLKSYSIGQRKLWELVVLVMKYRKNGQMEVVKAAVI